jgi:beta-alanine--pyruvate transaminase
MGAVFVHNRIYESAMENADASIELFHGYTYSGNPVACAAALAALDTYREDELFERAASLENYWADAMFSLKDHPAVLDVRAVGLVGAVELDPIAGEPTKRAFNAYLSAWDKGSHIRTTGDILALSPPLIIEKHEIDQLIGHMGDAIRDAA